MPPETLLPYMIWTLPLRGIEVVLRYHVCCLELADIAKMKIILNVVLPKALGWRTAFDSHAYEIFFLPNTLVELVEKYPWLLDHELRGPTK